MNHNIAVSIFLLLSMAALASLLPKPYNEVICLSVLIFLTILLVIVVLDSKRKSYPEWTEEDEIKHRMGYDVKGKAILARCRDCGYKCMTRLSECSQCSGALQILATEDRKGVRK